MDPIKRRLSIKSEDTRRHTECSSTAAASASALPWVMLAR